MTHNELARLVRGQMRHRGITAVQLHDRLRRRMSKQTVYNFVKHDRVIKSDTLLAILGELGLAICRGRKSRTP